MSAKNTERLADAPPVVWFTTCPASITATSSGCLPTLCRLKSWRRGMLARAQTGSSTDGGGFFH